MTVVEVEQEVGLGPITDQRGRDFVEQARVSQIEAPSRRHLSVASSHGRMFFVTFRCPTFLLSSL